MDDVIETMHGSIKLLEDMDCDPRIWVVVSALNWCVERLEGIDEIDDLLEE